MVKMTNKFISYFYMLYLSLTISLNLDTLYFTSFFPKIFLIGHEQKSKKSLSSFFDLFIFLLIK